MMLWRPVSECGAHCRPGGDAAVNHVTSTLRLLAAAGVLISGVVLVFFLRGAALRSIARALLKVMGVKLVWLGRVPRPGSLLVANHVSWLDALALGAVMPFRVIAKSEVAGWPFVGLIARAGGAIFLDRARPRQLPAAVAEVAAALRAGQSVAVFPEGTTFCGAEHGRFRPAVFQAAVDARVPVVPISIRYASPAAAFVGDDTLWSSVRRVCALRGLTVTLVAAPALIPEPDADRRLLARAAQASAGVRATRFGLAA